MSIDLSIVIPAYNEADRLAEGHRRLAPVLDGLGALEVEIVVIDDGSSDETMLRARQVYGHFAHTQFVQQPANRGKGAALRLGLRLAQGRHVITTDADMAIDPIHIPEFIAALEHADLVPGSRAHDGLLTYETRWRTFAHGAFNQLVRHYTRTSLRDTQCGAKGFRLGPARLLSLVTTVDRFAFDVEILFVAQRLGLTIEPLNVTWTDVAGSSVRPGHDAWSMLRDIRALRRTHYENPVVELATSVSVEDVAPLARQTRVRGLVLARAEQGSLLVLGRDDAVAGLGIASALKGTLRTATLDELRGRALEAL